MPGMGAVWEWITGAVGFFFGAFKGAITGLVGKVLATLGLSIVSFNAILPGLKSFVMGYVSGMPAEALNLLGALGIGQAMTMILSALTVRMAFKTFIVPTAVADSLGAGS